MKNSDNNFLPYIPRVAIHPAGLKHLLKGHPWITADSYTARYPISSQWLLGLGPNKNEVALFFHDPHHPQIKARVWLMQNQLEEFSGVKSQKDFFKKIENNIHERLLASLLKRESLKLNDRDNKYLVFGEADHMPGFFLQIFGKALIIQTYSQFWETWKKTIIEKLMANFEGHTLFWQERNSKNKEIAKVNELPETQQLNQPADEMIINEFGVYYKVRPQVAYDQGLYSDMASIRKKLIEHLIQSKRLLNLYCYTGAFSLFALKHKVAKVTSVDLSKKYLHWLEENLALNPDLNKNQHESLAMPSKAALIELKKQEQEFDFIICDPPSASSDGAKTTQALKSYDELLPLMLDILEPNGKILACLNTHHITRQKFELKIQNILDQLGKPAKIIARWSLDDDCPLMRNFPEGDYLKAFLIQKKK